MPKRRQFLLSTACALGLSARTTIGGAERTFSHATVTAKARRLAATPFIDPTGTVPEPWQNLGYDRHRDIQFKPDRALWKQEGLFEVQFFHPGFYFDHTVAIHTVVDGEATPVPYSTDLFAFGDLDPRQLGTSGLGFAGFRLHYPLNTSRYATEFAVFLGASYFRLIGRDQQYGLSARGLSVNTGLDQEEFPLFREFWLEKPAPEATAITLYALLDSHSVTGAYRFVLHPGTTTQVAVQGTLFPRRDIEKLGLAPLTSMFLFGENRSRSFDDFRPEVHDSDGLLMHAGSGEWLWRPLVNRSRLNISSFFDNGPRGFGLIQRDHDFASYQDLEANYHRRPSLWIQPLGDWGPGRIELVEIPSDLEINDNIVSFWVSEKPVQAGRPIEFAYLMHTFLDHGDRPPGGRAEATRIGSAARLGALDQTPADVRLFVVDFNRGELPFLGKDQPVAAVVSASSGTVSEPVALKNTATGGWRVFFDFYPDGDRPADIRCFLRLRNHFLTETWNYLWTPA